MTIANTGDVDHTHSPNSDDELPVDVPLHTLNVLLFAGAADLAGARSLSIQVPHGGSIMEIQAAVCKANSRLTSLASISRWAVDNEFVGEDFQLPVAATKALPVIAMIPPVSGG